MRETEKSFADGGRESPEWKKQLVDLLSGAVYEYLKGEGLLKPEEKMSDKALNALNKALRLTEKGGKWPEKETEDSS